MSVNIDNNYEKNYKKPSTGAIIGGVLAGGAIQSAVSAPSQLYSAKIIAKMGKLSQELTADEFSQAESAMKKIIQESGLSAKGVSILKATSENMDEINKIITKEIDKGVLKFLPKKVKEFIGNLFASQMAYGKNACYTFASKKIIMPENELGLAGFHEAGHAMNANLSKCGKILQKCRPMTLLALPIGLIALCKTKKAPDEKPKNSIDKATTFIKDNASKLTFAACIPVLAEEGLATYKGNKFAKKFLNPKLAKKVAKTNALGFSTYLAAVTLGSLGIFLGTKVKDAIASNKAVNN